MSQTLQQRNKALVLEAFDTLFNKRDYKAVEWYWSPNCLARLFRRTRRNNRIVKTVTSSCANNHIEREAFWSRFFVDERIEVACTERLLSGNKNRMDASKA
jgi:hypothetical protein